MVKKVIGSKAPHMKFLSRLWLIKLIRDISQQKLPFFALVVLCFFGIGSFLALTMGFTNLDASYHRIYKITNFADAEILTHEENWFNTSKIDEIINDFIENHSEIQGISYRLIVNTGYYVNNSSESQNRSFFLGGRAIGIQSTDNPINDLIFESGVKEDAFKQNNTIALEAHFAQKFEFKEGNYLLTTIENKTYNFLISGIVFSPEYLVIIPSKHEFLPTSTFGIIYLPIKSLQGLTNLSGYANSIVIKLMPNYSINERNKLIFDFFNILNYNFPNLFSSPILQEEQNSNLALHLDLESIEEIALILPMIVLGVTAISLYVMLGRMIQSQKRIIGIANCLGYNPDDIFLHYSMFSLVIGIIGSILGIIFGIVVSGLITWIYAYFMRFPQIIIIQIQIHIIIIGLLTGLGVSFLSGAIPAWFASRMIPRKAIQNDINIHKGSYSILEKILFINPLGLKLIVPIRNLFRNRIRTTVTIVTLASSVMILVVSVAFIESVGGGVNKQFNEISNYDILVKYDGLKAADLGVKEDIEFIRSLSGVLSVDPILQIPSLIYIEEVAQEVLIMAWNSSQPFAHKFEWKSGNDSLWSNGSIVLCSALAREYNLKTGSTISYSYPNIDPTKIYNAALTIWKAWSSWGLEIAKIKTLEWIKTQLISQGRDSLSFSMSKASIIVSGVSKEIWGSIIYTTLNTLTMQMGLDTLEEDLMNLLNINTLNLTPFSQLIIRVQNPKDIDLLERIKDSISTLDAIRSIEFGYDFQESIDTMMRAFNIIIFLFLICACIFAGASIFTTIYVNFQERKREISTMLTLGLSDKEFLFIFTIENLFQAILGFILGIPLGLWVAKWLFDNFLRVFYFEIIVQPMTWLLLWICVIAVVLISQIPAIYNGVKINIGLVTKDLSL